MRTSNLLPLELSACTRPNSHSRSNDRIADRILSKYDCLRFGAKGSHTSGRGSCHVFEHLMLRRVFGASFFRRRTSLQDLEALCARGPITYLQLQPNVPKVPRATVRQCPVQAVHSRTSGAIQSSTAGGLPMRSQLSTTPPSLASPDPLHSLSFPRLRGITA